MTKLAVITFLAATVAALCLSACGGGEGAAVPATPPVGEVTQPPVVQCTRTGPVTVALVGDSTQWGYDSTAMDLAPHNPGTELQAEMVDRFGAGVVFVTNYGVGGTRADQAPVVTADVVVVNYGINDWREGVTVAEFTARMKAIAGVTLVETMMPQLPLGMVGPQGATSQEFVEAVKGLGLPVADVNAYVMSLADWQAHVVDGLHPDDAVYKLAVDNVLAPAVAQQVKAVLDKAGCTG